MGRMEEFARNILGSLWDEEMENDYVFQPEEGIESVQWIGDCFAHVILEFEEDGDRIWVQKFDKPIENLHRVSHQVRVRRILWNASNYTQTCYIRFTVNPEGTAFNVKIDFLQSEVDVARKVRNLNLSWSVIGKVSTTQTLDRDDARYYHFDRNLWSKFVKECVWDPLTRQSTDERYLNVATKCLNAVAFKNTLISCMVKIPQNDTDSFQFRINRNPEIIRRNTAISMHLQYYTQKVGIQCQALFTPITEERYRWHVAMKFTANYDEEAKPMGMHEIDQYRRMPEWPEPIPGMTLTCRLCTLPIRITGNQVSNNSQTLTSQRRSTRTIAGSPSSKPAPACF